MELFTVTPVTIWRQTEKKFKDHNRMNVILLHILYREITQDTHPMTYDRRRFCSRLLNQNLIMFPWYKAFEFNSQIERQRGKDVLAWPYSLPDLRYDYKQRTMLCNIRPLLCWSSPNRIKANKDLLLTAPPKRKRRHTHDLLSFISTLIKIPQMKNVGNMEGRCGTRWAFIVGSQLGSPW